MTDTAIYKEFAPSRSELYAAAVEARSKGDLQNYLKYARELLKFDFADEIDHVTRKQSRAYFIVPSSTASMQCADAIVSIASCGELTTVQKRELIQLVRCDRGEELLRFLEGIGLKKPALCFYLPPLRRLL